MSLFTEFLTFLSEKYKENFNTYISLFRYSRNHFQYVCLDAQFNIDLFRNIQNTRLCTNFASLYVLKHKIKKRFEVRSSRFEVRFSNPNLGSVGSRFGSQRFGRFEVRNLQVRPNTKLYWNIKNNFMLFIFTIFFKVTS